MKYKLFNMVRAQVSLMLGICMIRPTQTVVTTQLWHMQVVKQSYILLKLYCIYRVIVFVGFLYVNLFVCLYVFPEFLHGLLTQ